MGAIPTRSGVMSLIAPEAVTVGVLQKRIS